MSLGRGVCYTDWFSRLFSIQPGNGADLSLQPRSPHGAVSQILTTEEPTRGCITDTEKRRKRAVSRHRRASVFPLQCHQAASLYTGRQHHQTSSDPSSSVAQSTDFQCHSVVSTHTHTYTHTHSHHHHHHHHHHYHHSLISEYHTISTGN